MANLTLNTTKKFTFKPKGEISGLQITINQLNSLENTDVDNSIKEVKDTLFCDIDEERQCLYLKQLISPDIIKIIDTT